MSAISHFLRCALVLVAMMSASSGPVAATEPSKAPSVVAPGEQTLLDRLIAPREARHPGQSAFQLVSEGPEAFVIRSRSAQLAMRSIDVQTFIWRADLTGKFLAHRLLEAADRGVTVRVLLDDMDVRDSDAAFAALAAHRNIAIRIFNPFVSRRGRLSLLGEGLLNLQRLNHRMHNKSWIADGRVAVVGGRNLGDEYFSASDALNFVDLDFAMIGPVVRDVSASFDRYWNSPAAHPIEIYEPAHVNARALAALRLELREAAAAVWASRYAHAMLTDEAIQRLIAGEWPMRWSANYRFAADDPLKVTMKGHDLQHVEVRRMLLQAVQGMQTDLMLISPYFVPGESITALLAEAVKSGKRVRVLTNSLVANDVSAVHGGYSRYREALLAGGVELWELKAVAGSTRHGIGLSARASLHTKALLMDRRIVFVGSYNLDPRSAWINCEQGVLVDSETLAREVADIFARHSGGRHAWHVTYPAGEVRWSDGTETFSKDPHSSIAQRLQAWLVRVLRLDVQL